MVGYGIDIEMNRIRRILHRLKLSKGKGGREREKSEKKKNLIRAINKVYILKREILVEYPLRLDLSGFDTKSNMHLSGRRR